MSGKCRKCLLRTRRHLPDGTLVVAGAGARGQLDVRKDAAGSWPLGPRLCWATEASRRDMRGRITPGQMICPATRMAQTNSELCSGRSRHSGRSCSMQYWVVALFRKLLARETGNRVSAGVSHSRAFRELWLLGHSRRRTLRIRGRCRPVDEPGKNSEAWRQIECSIGETGRGARSAAVKSSAARRWQSRCAQGLRNCSRPAASSCLHDEFRLFSRRYSCRARPACCAAP